MFARQKSPNSSRLAGMGDATMVEGIFAKWAPTFREIGLEPRPIKPGTKACKVRGWSKPDAEIDGTELLRWLTKYADFGIGLRMGTPLPGGGFLGALDIDRNEYARLGAAVLGNPPSGRFGAKGAVYFVRVLADLGSPKFKVAGDPEGRWGQVAECLFGAKLCVIPPTIHPDTGQEYRWLGTPLHELDFDELPIIGE